MSQHWHQANAEGAEENVSRLFVHPLQRWLAQIASQAMGCWHGVIHIAPLSRLDFEVKPLVNRMRSLTSFGMTAFLNGTGREATAIRSDLSKGTHLLRIAVASLHRPPKTAVIPSATQWSEESFSPI